MAYHDPILALLTRGRITEVDDADGNQRVSAVGLAGTRYSEILRAQPHGFSSHPPIGSKGFLLALGGASQRALFLGGEDDSARPKGLPLGAAAIYDHAGNIVSVVEQNIRIVHAAKVVVVAPKVVVESPDIRLGSEGAPNRVMTEAGPAVKVRAE